MTATAKTATAATAAKVIGTASQPLTIKPVRIAKLGAALLAQLREIEKPQPIKEAKAPAFLKGLELSEGTVERLLAIGFHGTLKAKASKVVDARNWGEPLMLHRGTFVESDGADNGTPKDSETFFRILVRSLATGDSVSVADMAIVAASVGAKVPASAERASMVLAQATGQPVRLTDGSAELLTEKCGPVEADQNSMIRELLAEALG